MAEELFALSTIAPAPAEQSDYDSICAALMQTERGRWFLEEYAKRNRSADTQVLLTAIQRIETVVCADRSERDKQAQLGFRTDLLEMAKAITRTRAEVAEIPADSGLGPEAAGPDGEAVPPPPSRDVFAAAERIRDVTWAMRGHGFDPSTCDQLEELAAAILSASALRDPTDRRASKLSDVLQYLEHRIETLLVGSHDGEAAAAKPIIGIAGPAPSAAPDEAAAEPGEPVVAIAADVLAADAEASLPPRTADADGSTAAVPDEAASPAAELATQSETTADAEPEPPAAAARESQAADSISPPIQDVEAETAELTSASEPTAAVDADGSTAAVPQEAASPAAELATQSEPGADADVEPEIALAEPAPAASDPSLAAAIDLPAGDAEPESPVAAALESPAEELISPPIQEVEAQTAELTSASEPSADAADQAPVDALIAPDLSATGAELELETPDAEANLVEDSISRQIQEVEAQAGELTSASEPAPADALVAAPDAAFGLVVETDASAAAGAPVPAPETALPATDAEPATATIDAGAREAQTAEPAPPSEPSAADEVEPTTAFSDEAQADVLADEAAPAVATSPAFSAEASLGAETAPSPEDAAHELGAAPSPPEMDPDTLPADPEVRLPIVDLTYATPWLPGSSGLQPAAAVLLAANAFLPEMHMRAAMPGIATAQAGEALHAIAASPETAAVAPAPVPLTIVIDLDEADWAALGPPEPDCPPRSPAAPQPEAAEVIPDWQIKLPSPAEAAELPAAPAASPPEPVATEPAQAAAAPVPQPPASDPLAALKVMSAEELIALFS